MSPISSVEDLFHAFSSGELTGQCSIKQVFEAVGPDGVSILCSKREDVISWVAVQKEPEKYNTKTVTGLVIVSCDVEVVFRLSSPQQLLTEADVWTARKDTVLSKLGVGDRDVIRRIIAETPSSF